MSHKSRCNKYNDPGSFYNQSFHNNHQIPTMFLGVTGPTGLHGSVGPTGPIGPTGSTKTNTFHLSFGLSPNADFYTLAGGASTIARFANINYNITSFGAIIQSVSLGTVIINLYNGPNTNYPVLATLSTSNSSEPVLIKTTSVGTPTNQILTIGTSQISQPGFIYSAYITY
jgi:hypothetical protein